MLALPMANHSPSWQSRIIHSLPMRVGLVFLTTLVVAGICPLMFTINRFIAAPLLKVVVLLLIGLSSGSSAAAILAYSSAPIQYLTGWFATIAGLLAIHPLTSGYIGISLSSIRYPAASWDAIAQGLLASGVTFLALKGWKPITPRKSGPSMRLERPALKAAPKKYRKTGRPQQSLTLKKPAVKLSQASQARRFWINKRLRIEKQFSAWKLKTSSAISNSYRRATSWLEHAGQKPATRLRLPHSGAGLRSKKIASMAATKYKSVRLVGKTENRCPYCLEIVKPRDPRGIKICPECHTYHHADCWAITGACQVPHYHE